MTVGSVCAWLLRASVYCGGCSCLAVILYDNDAEDGDDRGFCRFMASKRSSGNLAAERSGGKSGLDGAVQAGAVPWG